MDGRTMPDSDELLAELQHMWSRALGVDVRGESADFFALGGNSMAVVQMLVKVVEQYGKEIDYSAFLRDPTVGTLRTLIAGTRFTGDPCSHR